MDEFIEPNLHPLIVHFAVAFLITGPLVLLFVAWLPDRSKWKTGLLATGDWMLSLGILSAISAVAAGLQAYYTVGHDSASHAAMTDHRNWAIATVSVFLIMAAIRFFARSMPAYTR